ncbi:MAG: hypothetical protein PHZ24_09360 [Bacteroidales bacterium]|nr:hypothetical protein [Bacteroidales bacterium]MDY0142207.1 hypothetical protein [Bacteroidales bacterium]
MKKLLLIIVISIFTLNLFSQSNCSSAIALTPGTQQCGTNNYAGDFPDNSTAPNNPCSSYYNDGEYWFRYTGTGSEIQLDMSNLTATYSGVFVLDACPSSSPNCIASNTNTSTSDYSVTTPVLTSGVTYYIVIANWDAPYSTYFCLNATESCNPAIYNVTQTCSGDNSYYDLSIQISSMVEATSVNIKLGGTTYYTGVGVGTYTINGLTSGAPLNIIDNSDPTCISAEFIPMCDLCNSPTSPSNLCVNAPLIDLSQPFEGSTDCAYTVGPTYPTEACGISLDNDSWMTFIAGSTDVEMDYTVGDCSPIDDGIQLIVFTGADCNSLVELPNSCVNPTGELTTGTWNFSGLTIGETYYIRIDGYAGDLCDYYFEPVSGIVITPPNDECPDAILLDCDDVDIASNILATSIDAPAGCVGGGTPSEGIWYTFIGNGQEVSISTDNPGTNFDTEINIFVGPCTALTCVGGDNNGGTGTTSSYTFTTNSGTEYFIYVDGNGNAFGQFEISFTCNSTPCDADAGVWD